MSILERIPALDEEGLAALEANARRALTGSKASEAQLVLDAIEAERCKRRAAEAEKRRQAAANIEARVADLGLFDRAIMAFEELPPRPWEVDVLRALAENPKASGTDIALASGKSDYGYTNMAVGTLCHDREAYLGPAPESKVRPGEKLYSGLIVNFARDIDESGAAITRWELKPEVLSALRHLGIV